jgi:hypothetical protein
METDKKPARKKKAARKKKKTTKRVDKNAAQRVKKR